MTWKTDFRPCRWKSVLFSSWRRNGNEQQLNICLIASHLRVKKSLFSVPWNKITQSTSFILWDIPGWRPRAGAIHVLAPTKLTLWLMPGWGNRYQNLVGSSGTDTSGQWFALSVGTVILKSQSFFCICTKSLKYTVKIALSIYNF